MKASRTIAAALALLFTVSVMAVSVQAAPGPQGKKQEAKPPAGKASMPKEIIALIQEGLATRQGRQDIPFTLFKQLILPAQGSNLYPVFFFKAKNGDLGYVPSASGTGEMETTLNVFFQFFQPAPDGTLKPTMGFKALSVLKTEGEGYSAEQEDWYSLGMGLNAGKHTLAMVISTPDLKKLSVGYADVDLPGPSAYETVLWPTDPIAVKSIEQVEPDQRPATIHRGFFSWGPLKVIPNLTGEIAAGGELETFFFVLGAAFKDPSAPRLENEIEINFEVRSEDGKPAIRFAPKSFESYWISQPLQLVQTQNTLDEKGTVLSTKKIPLPAGKYSLAVTITDKISGKKADTKMAFAVK